MWTWQNIFLRDIPKSPCGCATKMADEDKEYLQFVAVHKSQLEFAGIPLHFWKSIHKKLKNEVSWVFQSWIKSCCGCNDFLIIIISRTLLAHGIKQPDLSVEFHCTASFLIVLFRIFLKLLRLFEDFNRTEQKSCLNYSELYIFHCRLMMLDYFLQWLKMEMEFWKFLLLVEVEWRCQILTGKK